MEALFSAYVVYLWMTKSKTLTFFLFGNEPSLLPRRIAAMPDIVLDVIVDTPATDARIAPVQVQQLDPLPVPPPTYESSVEANIASSWIVPTTSSPSSTFSAPPAATSSARSTSINDPDETLMANLSLFNGPHASPPVRHQQAVLDGQPPTAENLPAPSHPNSDNEGQQRAVQSATADSSLKMK